MTISLFGQVTSNFRHKNIILEKDSIQLDTLSIVPSTFIVSSDGLIVDSTDYWIDFFDGIFIWKSDLPVSLEIEYRVLDFSLSKEMKHRSLSDRRFEDSLKMVPFRYTSKGSNSDLFGGTSLNKNGSISRGIMFGNNQDLSVNSNLNLQLSGKISDEISILASISDDNIPIQPEGNTQQLQDFDQVYIQLFSDNWRITAGDFWMKKPNGYFMNYNKRAQGGSFSIQQKGIFSSMDSSGVEARVSMAVSKGKFGRNIIQGVENNQGPYKLIGADGEQFIIVLSGTEVVYIDGELMTRGQENDYVIDYNTSEITFTANRLITKDKRITVEFQYSDKNYARSIIEANTKVKLNDWDVFVNVYSEQDSKNQPLQQELDDLDKEILFNAGDNLYQSLSPSIDSLGYDENSNRYKKVDSLGYEVLVYSTDSDSAIYGVVFSDVGEGNGSYILNGFSAFGKVYQWVAPDTVAGNLIYSGRYSPVKILIPPKKRQMVTGGFQKYLGKGIVAGLELAYSNNDLNTFSVLDAEDNEGYAGTFTLNIDRKLNKNWQVKSVNKIEMTSTNFTYVERYRAVEFTRDWNLGNLNLGNQIIGDVSLRLMRNEDFALTYGFSSFNQEADYSGIRNSLGIELKKGLDVNYQGSYMNSISDNASNFYRHKAEVSKSKGVFKVGYQDEFEHNVFQVGDSLTDASYQFYDYQFYVSSSDSTTNKFKLFYRERIDQRTLGGGLTQATRAINPGGSLELLKNPRQQFILRTNYRMLYISDSSLVSDQPENGILNRVEYRANFLKGGITSTMFYEVGSGLELKREFAYIEVPAGQGVYTWVDYNNDEVKDLNEFEIAQYSDQAKYLRVSTPSNDYVKVFSNEFSEILNVNFKNIFTNKDFLSKFIGRFNSQTSYKIERKTTISDLQENLNPFAETSDDEDLLSIQNSLRQSTFFNRTNSKFGLEHTFISLSSKNLLVSGFDLRGRKSNELKLRVNITRKFTIQVSGELEQKDSKADYVQGRDYSLTNVISEGKLTFQPSTAFRIAAIAGYKDKRNDPQLSNDEAFITEVGLESKWNQLKKGTLLGTMKFAKIIFNGTNNTSLAYEMLESLQPGDNLIWTVGYQRTFANNLQLTINYNGRKSDGAETVHTGGLQLRAFF